MGKIPNISEVLRESSSETSRQLLGLLLSGLHPIGARSLSRSTGLTERQIGYAINNELKQLCSDLGFTLERVPRHGTYIHGSQHKKQSVLNALSRIQDKRDTLSPQDRRWSMLLQLAFEKTDWTLKTLSVWYVKSPVTIAKDIQLVRNMLKPSCNISWRRKSGYILTGDEGVIREITLRALFGLFHKKSLFAISGKKIAPVLDDALFSELVMPPQDVRFIRD
ncbi:MAG TPA: hypothetical protein DDZ66_02020, partial [Firmicutes bacterium]|nr:hypothetical protein [Bacillota bacterium]